MKKSQRRIIAIIFGLLLVSVVITATIMNYVVKVRYEKEVENSYEILVCLMEQSNEEEVREYIFELLNTPIKCESSSVILPGGIVSGLDEYFSNHEFNYTEDELYEFLIKYEELKAFIMKNNVPISEYSIDDHQVFFSIMEHALLALNFRMSGNIVEQTLMIQDKKGNIVYRQTKEDEEGSYNYIYGFYAILTLCISYITYFIVHKKIYGIGRWQNE